MISVRDLSVRYKSKSGKTIEAVSGLNLEVERGEVIGFIGPNGAGKTTTIKVLMGFREPTGGEVKLFGRSPVYAETRRMVGYLPEVALYYPFLTARESLRMFAELSDIRKEEREKVIDGLLKRVGLLGRDREPMRGRDREPMRGFSKGMLQRVGIAQAIIGEPSLLILDEVTSGLDPVARYDVRRILLDFKAAGKTVFFSSHELAEVHMLCDRVILIDGGRVIREGAVGRLLAQVRRFVVTVDSKALLADTPPGVYIHEVQNGHTTYVADDEVSRAALLQSIRAAGIRIVGETDEAGTLEDFFVRSIGYKVT